MAEKFCAAANSLISGVKTLVGSKQKSAHLERVSAKLYEKVLFEQQLPENSISRRFVLPDSNYRLYIAWKTLGQQFRFFSISEIR